MNHLFRKHRFLSFFILAGTLLLPGHHVQSQKNLNIKLADAISNNIFNVQKEDMPRLLGYIALISTFKSLLECGIEKKTKPTQGKEFFSFSKHYAAQVAHHVTSILCMAITLARLSRLNWRIQETRSYYNSKGEQLFKEIKKEHTYTGNDLLGCFLSLWISLLAETLNAHELQNSQWFVSFIMQSLPLAWLSLTTKIALEISQLYFDESDSYYARTLPADFSHEKYIVLQSPYGIWLSPALEVWQHSTPTLLTSFTKYCTEKVLATRYFIRTSALEKLPKDVAQALRILASNYQMLMLTKLSPTKLTWSFNERRSEQHDYEQKLFRILKQANRLSTQSPDTIDSLEELKSSFPGDHKKVSDCYGKIISLISKKKDLLETIQSLMLSPTEAACYLENMETLEPTDIEFLHNRSEQEWEEYTPLDPAGRYAYRVFALREFSKEEEEFYQNANSADRARYRTVHPELLAFCHNHLDAQAIRSFIKLSFDEQVAQMCRHYSKRNPSQQTLTLEEHLNLEILEVVISSDDTKATLDDKIKKAHRRLAIKYHPDKNLTNPEQAAIQFSRVSKAYKALQKVREFA